MAETELRAVRVPKELWQKALAQASREGTNLSERIRDYLTDYISYRDGATIHEELAAIQARLNTLALRLASWELKE